ncbi:MAG: (d)CMP kinase [Bdellovibrionales bacterium]|nr:(d)CMP kinase [Bdellovibrionales bacterium]
MKNQKVPFIVTIDGPSASGKTSVARGVAKKFGWNWISTGAFYRGLAYVAKLLQIDFESEFSEKINPLIEDKLIRLCQSSLWKVQMDPENTRVVFQGKDITNFIYREEVGEWASKVSLIESVRAHLLQAQRDCAQAGSGLVAEGRDCGSVIFPKAQVKIYLTASSSQRAERRALEEGSSPDLIKAAQKARDAQDSERKVAPLVIPEDSLVIDASSMDLNAVIQTVANTVLLKK